MKTVVVDASVLVKFPRARGDEPATMGRASEEYFKSLHPKKLPVPVLRRSAIGPGATRACGHQRFAAPKIHD